MTTNVYCTIQSKCLVDTIMEKTDFIIIKHFRFTSSLFFSVPTKSSFSPNLKQSLSTVSYLNNGVAVLYI